MRLRCPIAVAACCALVAVGCRRASPPATGTPPATRSATSEDKAVQVVNVPVGWKVYVPPEKDFSVAVPAEPHVARRSDEKIQKVRVYAFRKGDAELSVMLFSERTGAATKMDSPEEIRADPQLVAGSLRDVALGALRGVEFRRNDPAQGECAYRSLQSPDGSRAVALTIMKPQSLSKDEVRAFFESFKDLR